ncbi:Heme transporter IsdDEF, permease component IsdF [Clostridiaceae bacterium JG1575]|nr:Heme transporter IsdDEF, permease component IsdF [Clostridiaceae bacterium JG1575]
MDSHIGKSYPRKTTGRNLLVIGGGLALLLMSALGSMNTGYSKILPMDTLRTLLGGGQPREELIVFSFRLPRIVLSMLIGAGLAVSGGILQGITGNPLADPGLLGLNAGAGLMVVLYVMFYGIGSSWTVFMLPPLALAGAAAAALLVWGLSYQKGAGVSPVRMTMTGIAVQAGFVALTTLLVVTLDDTQYGFVSSWQLGSLWGAKWSFVGSLLLWLCILLPLTYRKAKILDILRLGDETALGLGLLVSRERRRLLFLSVALAAACVSVSGSISFVGLMAPHMANRIVGPRQHIALPVGALLGAVLVSVADTMARMVIQPSSLPTGVMVSILGAPYFIFLLSKREKE